MKILFYIIIGLGLVIVLLFVGLSIASRKTPELGLLNGQLRPCPSTPNCVCSEYRDTPAFIPPLSYTTAVDKAWRHAREVVVATGGEVVTDAKGYLHARYVTPLMRFVDDVELRLDESHHQIQIRSASRVGRSDLGANRQRVERIRTAWKSK